MKLDLLVAEELTPLRLVAEAGRERRLGQPVEVSEMLPARDLTIKRFGNP
jgi:hypothetical protein